MDEMRSMLRHVLATIAYRGGKVLRDAPASFAGFEAGAGVRTPLDVLAHTSDLFDWALSMAKGEGRWVEGPRDDWNAAVARFHASLKALDDFLASDLPLSAEPLRLFQGPFADALTHVGQLAMLRRMAGAPIRGESYNRADIRVGRVGSDQAPPVAPFSS